MGLEGIICKQADAPYRSGRGRSWLKVKCQGREEFIVLGFTPPAGFAHRHRLAASRLPRSERRAAICRRRRHRLHRRRSWPRSADASTGWPAIPRRRCCLRGRAAGPAINWVQPELVAEVQFIGWSGSGRIRHATYLGLREDKEPQRGGDAGRRPRGQARSRPRRRARSCAQRAKARRKAGRAAMRDREAGRARARARRRTPEGVRSPMPTASCGPASPSGTSRNIGSRWPSTLCRTSPDGRWRWCAARRASSGEQLLPEARQSRLSAGRSAPGNADGAPYLGHRRRRRAARLRAGVGDRAARLGRDARATRRTPTGWCSTSTPARALPSPRWSAPRSRCASG